MQLHFHCCVIDRVFAEDEDEQVHFAWASTLTPDDKAAAQKQARIRVRPSVALSTETHPVVIALQMAAFRRRVPVDECRKVPEKCPMPMATGNPRLPLAP